METPPPLPPPQQKQGAGCFAKGCLVVIIAGGLLICAFGISAWFFYGKAIGMFTATQPADVRIENVSDVDLQNAEKKLNQLDQATASNQETTVEFSAAELNAMIAREPLFADLNNRARLAIVDSLMTLEVSVPLDSVPWRKMRGRWFNGRARFGFSFNGGEFDFDPKSVEVSGQVFPEEFFTGMMPTLNQSINDGFRRGIEKNNQAALFWKHIKTMRLDRDKVVVVTQRL
jgi:hypothetical protein